MFEITNVENTELLKEMEQKITDTDDYCKFVVAVADNDNIDDVAYIEHRGRAGLLVKTLAITMSVLQQQALNTPALFEVAKRMFEGKKVSEKLLEKSLEEFKRED